MVAFASQSQLLDESLALLFHLGNLGQTSSYPWWGSQSRRVLHDELFRYFVALGAFGARGHYTEQPRAALAACFSGSSSRVPSRAPRLAAPRDLGKLAGRRQTLRTLVDFTALQLDIKATFGPNAFTGKLDKAAVRPAEQLALDWSVHHTIDRGSTAAPIKHWSSGTVDFTRHFKIGTAVSDVLEASLPFGPNGVALPVSLQRDFDNLDRFAAWIFEAARENSPLTPDIFAVGIALALTAQAYLADATAALVGTALPLHRLYEETQPGSDQSLSVSTPSEGQKKKPPVATKGLYNAYLAVGLLEALSGERMLHPDPGNDGYSSNIGALKDTFSLQPFKSFWGASTPGSAGGSRSSSSYRHATVVAVLEAYLGAPILRRAFKGTKQEAPKDSSPMTTVDLRSLIVGHAYSQCRIPLPPPGTAPADSRSSAKKAAAKKPSVKAAPPKTPEVPDDKYGHLITHLQLHAAWQLAARLGQTLQFEGKPFFRVSVGSERWGGNHRPHREHRDGFTYDIGGLPYKYRKWATDAFKREEEEGASKTKSSRDKKPPPKSIPAIGIPKKTSGDSTGAAAAAPVPSRTSGKPKSKGKSEDEGAPRLALRVYANDDGKTGKITKDESLTSTFAALIDQLLKGTTAAPTSDWDVFAGTPILLNDSDEPDDNALRWNLVGHVALALSGVTKWVYASWYEHLFAVRVVSALLAPPKCPDGLASLATHVRPVIATKQFYWAPEDHHDHWHIVFGGADVKRTDSLGPSHYAPDPNTLRGWILFWDTLGVDLEAFRLDLEKREPQHPQLFHGIATERQRLLELLIALKTSNAALSDDDRQARSALRDQCLLTLATEIQTVTWKEIPSLAEGTTFEEWVRNADLVKRYTMPEGYKGTRWKEWPSDVEDAPPEESVPPSADDPEDPD